MGDQTEAVGVARASPSVRRAGQASNSERTKVSRACDACKSKKARCSGTWPCIRCSRNKIRCSYNARYSRGRPPTPQPASGSLHSEVASPPTAEFHMRLDCPSQTTTQFDGGQLLSPEYSQSRGPSTEEPANASRTSPEPGIGSEIEGFYFGPTSGLSFLDRAFRRLVNEQGRLSSLHDPAAAVGDSIFTVGDRPFPSIPKADQRELPPLDEGLELIRVYFETAIATYRFLHRPTIEQRFRHAKAVSASGNSRMHDMDAPPANISPVEKATLFFVLAFASFHKEYNLEESVGVAVPTWSTSDQYFLAAEAELAQETGRPCLESVQARLVKCIYLLTTARITSAWYCFGNVAQIATTIGMHRKTPRARGGRSGNPQDYLQTQFTRRAFWSLYIIDKYLGVILGRPRCLHDEDNDQLEPDCVEDQDMTTNGPVGGLGGDCSVLGLIYHAHLAKVVGMTSRELYSLKPLAIRERTAALERLGTELRTWKEGLPAFLGQVNPSILVPMFRRQSNCLRLAHAHAIIHLNRHFLLQSPRHVHHTHHELGLVSDGIEQCITAARGILETFDTMSRTEPAFYAFWWSQYVAFCAVVVVYIYMLQSLRDASSSNRFRNVEEAGDIYQLAERCQGHLSICTKAPAPNRRYGIILEELRRQLRRQMQSRQARVVGESDNEVPGPAYVEPPGNGSAQLGNGEVLLDDVDMDCSPTNPFLGWEPADWLELDSWAFGGLPENLDI